MTITHRTYRTYRTKSIDIEAIPFTGGMESSADIIKTFLPGTGYKARRREAFAWQATHGEIVSLGDTEHLLLKHEDALPVRMEVGDWLIKNSFGTIYVMPGADFARTYELATPKPTDAELRKEIVLHTLRSAAQNYSDEYERLSAEQAAPKLRAAYRLASVLLASRADRLEAALAPEAL